MIESVRTFAGIAFLAFLSVTAPAQTSDTASDAAASSKAQPAFDLADVHASPHSNNPFMRGGTLRGEQYIVRQASMVDLVANAYGVSNDNVLSGPAWLDTYRFDILAKAPRTTSPDDVKLMLRTLLADRFHLVVHNDTKPVPSYVLRVDTARGGAKLKETDGTASPNCEQHHTPTLPDGSLGHFSVNCRNQTIDGFQPLLADLGNLYMPNKPLVNATNLKGAYDFDLEFTYKPAPGGLTIFDAVDKQLGLKLALENYPTPVIVVDSVSDKPTPNPPAVKENLPPPPPGVFDVAVITPSKPDTQLGLQIKGGQVNVSGVTMKFLITWAWSLNPNNNEALVGAPKWMSDDHYDILGKAAVPDPQATGRNAAPQIDFDALQEMMRSLVIDRLKLQSHMEERPADAYILVAANPKMKKGDPMMRTGCKEGPGTDGKDPRIENPILGRLLTCQNMTMAEFGDKLRSLAGGYIYYPVEDHTGLQGGYDFTLSFSTIGQLQSGPPRTTSGDSSGSSSSASEPNGGISLFDAINKQLGLKLEKERRPEPMLVIDHIEKPTDN
jgi:uncharacterized protein (TIGR03435 family)